MPASRLTPRPGADLAVLRAQHHICGVLAGTLPHLAQQNVFLGMPLVLLPEEVVLLVQKGACTRRFVPAARMPTVALSLSLGRTGCPRGRRAGAPDARGGAAARVERGQGGGGQGTGRSGGGGKGEGGRRRRAMGQDALPASPSDPATTLTKLVASGRDNVALEQIKELRTAGRRIPGLDRIEGDAFYDLNRLPEAEAAFARALAADPKSLPWPQHACLRACLPCLYTSPASLRHMSLPFQTSHGKNVMLPTWHQLVAQP